MLLSSQYLAGFFDGDGCVAVRGNGYLQVTLANRHLDLLQTIHAQYGGCLTVRKDGMNRLDMTTQVAVKFLSAITPYCIAKKKVAELGIKLGSLSRGASKTELQEAIRQCNRISSPKGAPGRKVA